jgi:hypothetical protein
MSGYEEIDRGMKLLPIDLSVQLLPGTTSNRGSFQKDIFYSAQPSVRDRGLSNKRFRSRLRLHALTLFVRGLGSPEHVLLQ